ncbi:ParB/RepB/Spo0J family partition protein [Asticcacaulis machinosus]|uniref:ParB/RepB/Spo0J family partition protein n=1 Tax=Asticcacaulis machinosus TaxID=2984211 RepID=A0ABT5HH44_9CAUL|nr:ParB/RepB/Spo0J family partition protein [Asticcacaulis machinosus]
MTTSNPKIIRSQSRDIPFHKLTLSQSNVRRIKAGQSIEDLALSIARRGLIQGLHVRPVLAPDGSETGMFEVPAGGRRFRALEWLVKHKHMTRHTPIPCIVSDAGSEIAIEELSLVENIERAPLHPLDQFQAFKALLEKGMNEEDIAAAFFVPVQVVKQRLRLVTVSPTLLNLYADDAMTLEQLMAFSVSDSHERQEQVWQAVSHSWQKEPWQIRRMLTETTVPAADKRAIFLGLEAYQQAGGVILRDLFEPDRGGWLQDALLLDRLVNDKLAKIAEVVAGEGWKWIDARISLPYGVKDDLRDVKGRAPELSGDDRARQTRLTQDYERIETEYEGVDELPDDIDQRLGEIESELAALTNRPRIYEPADIDIAGAFISIDSDGEVLIERGFVRPEDEPALEITDEGVAGGSDDPDAPPDQHSHHAPASTAISVGGTPLLAEDDDEDNAKPLSDRLLTELTAYRTLALRNAFALSPHTALTALLHRLVSDAFGYRRGGNVLEVHVNPVSFPVASDDLSDSPAALATRLRHDRWADLIPDDDEALWAWLTALDDLTRLDLLAHCLSFGINAVYERPNPYGSGISAQGLAIRMAQSDRLAQATGLDLVAAGWRATVGNYLYRVPKSRILEAVREGVGERAAQRIDHLKKAEMAEAAERLLAKTGWLPEPLRLPPDHQPTIGDTCANPVVHVLEASDDDQPPFDPDIKNDDDPSAVAAQ